MDALTQLQNLEPHELHLTLNAHHAFYEEADHYYNGIRQLNPYRVKDVKWDEPVWELQLYPQTGIMFYFGVSNDLEALIQWGIEQMQNTYTA